MFVTYFSALTCFALSRWLQIDVGEYRAYALPDPWSPWLDVPVVLTSSLTLTLLAQLKMVLCWQKKAALWRAHVDSTRCRVLPLALSVLVGLWLIAIVAFHRTHGVTASDPYCYVQMAIDLAERGTAEHIFPLAGLARDLGLPTWPAVHIGYHPPGLDDLAPTMWSIGWPLLMAPLYRLGGLEALYWAAPLAALLALSATWCLVNEALYDLCPVTRWSAAALTCALAATSPEGSERVLVPMADAAAQLFTVLTLWLLLRGQRARGASQTALYGVLAGLCFGMAYFVRHPQLPLGVAAPVAAFLASGFSRRQEQPNRSQECSRRVHGSPNRTHTAQARDRQDWVRGSVLLLAFAVAALLVALPDLIYHQAAFGHWFKSESSEWFLLSPRYVGRSFWNILQQGLLRPEETGYLFPLVLYGAWRLWRSRRRAAWILGSGTLAVLLFHLFYAALRPRDLIAILPVFYFCGAYGLVMLWRWAQRRRTLLAAMLVFVCTVFMFARSYRTLALPWREDAITFGHVHADQLDEFRLLRQLTEEDAVVGSMLNGGAIELHAGRAAVHPTPWTEQELYRWVEALSAQQRPFYVLDDGEEMPLVLARLEGRYRVRPVATLGLPYFAIGGGNLPRSAHLYAIERP
jgi:hypothetical protein